MIGQTVSHYRILAPLGEGGMGTVYLAEDTHLGRRVAVKFPSLNSQSHDQRARFLREARAISELSHPAIATLFDYGESEDGRPFLVMELARGKPLADLMRNGEINLTRAVEIVSDVATALAEAHRLGVIHRDIKPSNIMVDERGQVKVLDFGLAKQLHKDNILASEPEAPTLLSTETRSGVVLGTPAYLSPEQAMGLAVDGRSDLFALGVVLYELITGRAPFGGSSFIEIAANVLHVEPPPPSRHNSLIPKQLDFIALKALAKKPEKRYQTAGEMIADLQEVKEHLDQTAGQTLIKRTSPSLAISTYSKTYNNLSQMLQRPRVPILYLIIGTVVVGALIWLGFRLVRPSPHKPTADAQRWYDIGTSALRDTAYYQASQALSHAIEADDAFMLAHARMAEALVELDYVDRAKDELLRVTAADRSTMSQQDALYLEAIAATARHDFAKSIEFYNQIVAKTPDSDKAYVLVDLGRAYKNNNEIKKAIDSFTEATVRSPQYATAYLHLGILHGQQGELATARSSFDKAESIYQALGNLEGRAEVVFQRGALLNKRNQIAEARVQLEQALNLAKASDNKSQTIKTLLQLCSLYFDTGETARATDYAREAVDLAQRNGMENLSAQGLIDLGNSFLIRGDFRDAEKYLTQALESAQRARARRNEARARVSLASLRGRQNDQDAAVAFLEPALAFYQQGGYLNETSSCLALLARAKLKKADYAGAAKAHEQLIKVAEQLNDQSLLAMAHAEKGSALVREEKFTEALDHLNQAFVIYNSQGVQRSIGYNLLLRSYCYWSLGMYREAESLLTQAAAIADKPGGELKELSAELKLQWADIAQSQERFADSRARSEKLLELMQDDYPVLSCHTKQVLGLALARSGALAEARRHSAEAVDLGSRSNDVYLLASTRVAYAEVLNLSSQPKPALSNALQAVEVLAAGEQIESEWRAFLMAAWASQQNGDSAKAREFGAQASTALVQLQQRWGPEKYNSYLARPDVERWRKQLAQFVSNQ